MQGRGGEAVCRGGGLIKKVQRGIEVRRVACVLAKAYELAHQERCGVK